MRHHHANKQSTLKLTNCRSIVASVVRIVYGFQIQAAGYAKPTDVDGTFPLSPFSYHKPRPANNASTSRRTNNAALLGNARSRHLPNRHQSPLPTFSRYERIPTILRRQHPQCGLAQLIAVTAVETSARGTVTIFEYADEWVHSVRCAGCGKGEEE